MTESQIRKQINSDACRAGYVAGTLDALGVTHVVHARCCTRFPWQAFLKDGRCVLLSAKSDCHAVIRSRFSQQDDGCFCTRNVNRRDHSYRRGYREFDQNVLV